MILLDIPQGVVTFGSAILASIILALVSLTIALFRVAVSLYGRLRALETNVRFMDPPRVMETNARMEILWEWYRLGMPNLRTVEPPENPMKQERWNELTDKLTVDELTDDEAAEFLAALLKREEQARKEKDRATLAILGPGIILTKWQLKEKEIREQK